MGIAMVVLPDPEMDRLRVKNFNKLWNYFFINFSAGLADIA